MGGGAQATASRLDYRVENRKQIKINVKSSKTTNASRTRHTILEKRLSNLNLRKIRTRMIEIKLKATTAR